MFLSCTCFKHLMFIIRKSLLYMQLYVVCFSRIYASSLAGWRMCSCTSSNLLELWAGHLDCRPQWPTVQVAMHESLKMTWRNQARKSGETATVLHVNDFFIASNRPVHSLSDCRCSFQSMSSNTLMPDSLNPLHSVNFKTLMVLSFDSDSDSSASSTGLCFNFSKMVDLEPLMMAV